MTTESILYEKEDYFVIRAKHGYEVYKNENTHSIRCASIGYVGEQGLSKSIDEINRRLTNKK